MAADVIVKIDADTALAIKNIEKFARDAVKSIGGMASSFIDLGHIAGTALAGFTLHKIIDESVEADKAVVHLKGSLLLTGEATEENVKHFEELAKSIQNLTGVDDEVVINQAAFLKGLGATNEQIDKIIPAAADLSVALNQDLATSVKQLAELADGSLPKGLAKSVNGLRNLSDKQIETGQGVDFLAAKFKGFADNVSGSLSVQISLLVERFKNLLQAIGDILTKSPLFTETLSAVSNAILAITESLKGVSLGDIAAGLARLTAQAVLFIAVFKPSIFTNFFGGLQQDLARSAEQFAFTVFKFITGFKSIELGASAAKLGINLFKAAATFGVSLLIDQLVSVGVQASSIGNFFKILGLDIVKLFIGFGQLTTGLFELIFTGLSKLPKVGDSFKGTLDEIHTAQKRLSDRQENINVQIQGMTKAGIEAAKAQAALGDSAKGAGAHVRGLGSDAIKTFADVKKRVEELAKALKFSDVSGIDKIRAEQKEKLDLLDEAHKKRIINEQEYQDLRRKLDIETAKKEAEERKKALNSAGISGGIGQKIFTAVGGFEKNSTPETLNGNQEIVKDLVSNLGKGAEGAKKILGESITAVASGLTGIPPQIIGPVVELLGKSKEEVKGFVTSFFSQIPEFLKNVISNIGPLVQSIIENIGPLIADLLTGLVEGLTDLISSLPDIALSIVESLEKLPELIAERLPVLIEKLGQALAQLGPALAIQAPAIATRFAIAMAEQAPFIAISFVTALVKEAPRFITELIKSIPKAAGNAVGNVASGIGGAIKGIGSVFGFAEGGLVPPGAPDDNFVARLTSGEFIVNNGLTPKLEAFLNSQLGGAQSAPVPAPQAAGTQQTIISLVIGEEQLASVLLNLNRNGFRTA